MNIQKCVEKEVKRLNKTFDLATKVVIKDNDNGRGYYDYKTDVIVLSWTVLSFADMYGFCEYPHIGKSITKKGKTAILSLVQHEYAHAIQFARFGVDDLESEVGHGENFRSCLLSINS